MFKASKIQRICPNHKVHQLPVPNKLIAHEILHHLAAVVFDMQICATNKAF